MALPIKLYEHMRLTNMDIRQSNICFANITMESDKHIVVREMVGDSQQLVVVDVNDPAKSQRHQISADSVIMHPSRKILALKSDKILQILDIEKNSAIKSHLNVESVIFWTWVDEQKIGIIDRTAVYHWSIYGDSAPQKVFDRHTSLAEAKVISYKADFALNWLVMICVSTSEDNRVIGNMQLFSAERKISQVIKGHAACFVNFKVESNSHPSNLFCFSVKNKVGGKLYVCEVGQPAVGNQPFVEKVIDVPYDTATDFPVSMEASSQHGIIYLVTKHGFVHLYDIDTGTWICSTEMSPDTVFVTTEYTSVGGIMGIDCNGLVFSASINKSNMINYLTQQLQNPDLTLRLASRWDLPGAKDLYVNTFNNLIKIGECNKAAIFATNAPNGMLRITETLQNLTKCPSVRDGDSPLFVYITRILERGKLNGEEKLFLCASSDIADYEKLGDLLSCHDQNTAVCLYLRSDLPFKQKLASKIVRCFIEMGQFSDLFEYVRSAEFKPDYLFQLRQILRSGNQESAAKFARMLVSESGEPLADLDEIIGCFMEVQAVQPCTQFLLEVLKGDKPEEGHLQTKLLEMNLLAHPQVADDILGKKTFSNYDRASIAQLCEKAGLLQRALEHFTDLYDIKRTIVRTAHLKPEWLVGYFGSLSVENSFECLKAMLAQNIRQNLQVVVQIASKYHEQLGIENLIDLFETNMAFSETKEPDVVIEASLPGELVTVLMRKIHK